MSIRDEMRAELKNELRKRVKESGDRKEDSGRWRTFLDPAKIEGIPIWKPEKGEHIIDILTYKTGPNDPYLDEGKWAYVLDVWVHQGVGVNEDNYVCLARNWEKPCPICDFQKEYMLHENFNEKIANSLYPKRRTVYNIICYDSTKEEDKGIQIWEVAHFFIEKDLSSLAKDRRTGEPITFSHPETGMSLSFEIKAGTYQDAEGNTRPSTVYVGLKFEQRDYNLWDLYQDEDGNLDIKPYCLDDLIKIPTYEELEKIFLAGVPKDLLLGKEQATRPASDQDSTESGTVGSRRSRRQKSNPPAEEQADKEPVSNTPAEEKKTDTPAEGNQCPHGGVFGTDINTMESCNNCEVWDDCARKRDQLKNATKGSEGDKKGRRRRKTL